MLGSNKAINSVFKDLNNKYGFGSKRVANTNILERLTRDARKSDPNAVVDPRNLTAWQKVKALAMNDQGEYSKARIAGIGAAGVMGASAAGRIISGGGLYKDADGNTDIIGIPFI